jgi:hypothetical protein
VVVASLGEVAEKVSAACDRASKCKDALALAQDLTEDAQAVFAMALEGDTTGDKDKVLAVFAEVVTGINDLWIALDKGMGHAQPPSMPSRAQGRARHPTQAIHHHVNHPRTATPSRCGASKNCGASCHRQSSPALGRRPTAGGSGRMARFDRSSVVKAPKPTPPPPT